MVLHGRNDDFGEFPLQRDPGSDLRMVNPQYFSLGLNEGEILALDPFLDFYEIILNKFAQDHLSDVMQQACGKKCGIGLPIQPFADDLRKKGAGHGMAPQVPLFEGISLVTRPERTKTSVAQDDFHELVETDQNKGLLKRMDLPGESEIGRIADFEDMGGDRLVVLDDLHYVPGRGLGIIDYLERALDHRGKGVAQGPSGEWYRSDS